MESRELVLGRRIAVILRPGDDVLPSIVQACRDHDVRQGIVSTFLGAFTSARVIGTRGEIADPDLPLADSVTVHGVEGVGSGTIAATEDGPVPHVHVSLGVKGEGAAAVTGHLVAATAHYIVEIVLDEVLSPALERTADPYAGGLPTLAFGDRATADDGDLAN